MKDKEKLDLPWYETGEPDPVDALVEAVKASVDPTAPVPKPPPPKLSDKPVLKGVSGSRIAAVAGLSPWSGPHDVWLEVFGAGDELEITTDLRRGTHLGPALAHWYAEETGKHVSHIGRHEKTRVHPEYPIVRARPDGLVGDTPRSKRTKVLEVKSPHWRTADQWGEPGGDAIPEHYLPQVTWEMASAQIDMADVAALIGGQLLIYTVRFNPRLFEALLEVALRFWRDHVETRKPPEIDGSEGARNMLLKLYPKETTDIVEATEVQVELLKKHVEAGALIKQLEAEKKAIGNELMAFLGEHEGMKTDVANVYWKMRSGKVKWKDLAEDAMDYVPTTKHQLIKEKHTGADYRHFQVYPRKKKK